MQPGAKTTKKSKGAAPGSCDRFRAVPKVSPNPSADATSMSDTSEDSDVFSCASLNFAAWATRAAKIRGCQVV